jgi:hypothetical protein
MQLSAHDGITPGITAYTGEVDLSNQQVVINAPAS